MAVHFDRTVRTGPIGLSQSLGSENVIEQLSIVLIELRLYV